MSGSSFVNREELFDWVRMALLCAGHEKVDIDRPGFEIYWPEVGGSDFSNLESVFGKSPDKGIIVIPLGFPLVDAKDQAVLIQKAHEYEDALKKMGLQSQVLISGQHPKNPIEFGIWVYVPTAQELKPPFDQRKVQVEFRVTMYGQPVAHHLRHEVVAELTIESGVTTKNPGLGWVATGIAPRNCRGSERPIVARGLNIAAAVISWLFQLDQSMDYVPVYKLLEEKERDRKAEIPLEPRDDL